MVGGEAEGRRGRGRARARASFWLRGPRALKERGGRRRARRAREKPEVEHTYMQQSLQPHVAPEILEAVQEESAKSELAIAPNFDPGCGRGSGRIS